MNCLFLDVNLNLEMFLATCVMFQMSFVTQITQRQAERVKSWVKMLFTKEFCD